MLRIEQRPLRFIESSPFVFFMGGYNKTCNPMPSPKKKGQASGFIFRNWFTKKTDAKN